MKGIILSGGNGSRLFPLTKVISKQLLPVYNQPMIFFPLETLVKAGVKEILIIVSPGSEEQYKQLLGDGTDFGVRLFFKVQDKPEGLAQAFLIGEEFTGNDDVCMILGDNIFEDDFSESIKSFKKGGQIFVKKVKDPERFGVVKFEENMKVLEIEEKPKKHISDYAITGLYIYDSRVIEAAKSAQPSLRGELEITEIHNWFLKLGELKVDIVEGEWVDAGTFESLFRASELIRQKTLKI